MSKKLLAALVLIVLVVVAWKVLGSAAAEDFAVEYEA